LPIIQSYHIHERKRLKVTDLIEFEWETKQKKEQVEKIKEIDFDEIFPKNNEIMAKDTLLTIDSKELEDYIKHLKSLDYRSMNNGAASIVRQVATDIKSTYTAATPRRQSKTRTGKYGTTAGNLQRSLRTFRKRQKRPICY
jgi:hypothetical protein